jgi:hypothetical protein
MNEPGFDPDTDSDLRARFVRLRDEERSAAPDFLLRSLPRPRRAIPGRWRLVGALAAGLLLALAGGVWRHRFAPADGEPEPALADWRSPTDFLLDTSNRELFAGQPKLGELPSDLSTERSTTP